MQQLQEMKLYEAFGESAPQAALQIAIILEPIPFVQLI